MERPLKVLVMDDEALIGLWLQAELERLGCEVVGVAASRKEALGLFEREAPDAVFLDICLPDGEDGVEIAREMLAAGKSAVVFVTGFPRAAVRARAEALTPAAFLKKPVRVAELEAVVARIRGGAA